MHDLSSPITIHTYYFSFVNHGLMHLGCSAHSCRISRGNNLGHVSNELYVVLLVYAYAVSTSRVKSPWSGYLLLHLAAGVLIIAITREPLAVQCCSRSRWLILFLSRRKYSKNEWCFKWMSRQEFMSLEYKSRKERSVIFGFVGSCQGWTDNRRSLEKIIRTDT